MNEQNPSAGPSILLPVRPVLSLILELSGGLVPLIRDFRPEDPQGLGALGGPEAFSSSNPPIPDVVALFARAASAGLFGSAQSDRTPPRVDVLRRHSEGAPSTSFQLGCERLPPHAFRVLHNLMRGLMPERLAWYPGGQLAPDEPCFDPRTINYPPSPPEPAWILDVSASAWAQRPRAIRLVFSAPISQEQETTVMALLRLWCCVLILGGYQDDQDVGRWPAGDAEVCYRLDRSTIEQPLSAFGSNPAALNAMEWIARFLPPLARVSSIEIE